MKLKERENSEKVRCQRYRDKRKSAITINSRMSRHQTITFEKEIKIKRCKEQGKQKVNGIEIKKNC